MCGIAGFVAIAGVPADADAVAGRMIACLAHRGPDESGLYTDAHAALGHRRLSIIDLASGQQPMHNEDASLRLVYNGEIFNHAALRPELERAGHQYRSRCDTETILHSYEQHGADCVQAFRGMFAFAIWDRRAKKLFCARDRLGIKPFYYYWDGRLFAFASEVKALLEHPAITPALDESVLPEYLAFGYTSGSGALFAGIRSLPPGHWLELDLGRRTPEPAVVRYWDVPAAAPSARPETAWIGEFRERLDETVRMRLMSDVPLGMFLSGGVDSSAIAALVARSASGTLNTYSVGYAEAGYSELGFARTAAAAIGSRHHEVLLSREQFFDALPRLIWHEDEPITWPSSVSLYFVSKLAARDVKVVLTGEGADELFGGYARYRSYLLNSRLANLYRAAPAGLRALVRRFVQNSPLLSASLRRKIGHTFLAREGDLESLYLENFYAAFSRGEQAELLLRPSSGGCLDEYSRHWEASAGRSLLGRMLYADQKTYLVELLMKQDRMSMACSIESRVPLLDHRLVEFAATVPDSLKIRNGSGKYILKKAVEDLLPREIVYRRKRGFPTPLRDWLRGERLEPFIGPLTRPGGFLAAYLDMNVLGALLRRHREGAEDATDRIWRLLNLHLWAETFLCGRRTAAGLPCAPRS